MINFLRISNRIKLGDYLHSDGTIDDKVSSDIIGVCVIPSNFLPDNYARFMSLLKPVFTSLWNEEIVIRDVYKKSFPVVISNYEYQFISPYSPDGSFNPDYLRDMEDGNVFQDYMGYENTRIYKEKYGNLEKSNAFTTCIRMAPSYKNEDWYLPSIGELAFIPPGYKIIDKKVQDAIRANSPGNSLSVLLDYWNSSEYDGSCAWYIGLLDGYIDNCGKNNFNYVRDFLIL